METENGNVGYIRVDLALTMSIMDGIEVKFMICVATMPKIAIARISSRLLERGFIQEVSSS